MATETPDSTSNKKENNDAEPQAPASPPLPEKHTPVTPGPRAARMQELFGTTLRHTLNKISWENVAACYPTIAASRPEILRDLRGQMVERLGMLCNNDFERIMDSRAVVPKLNELESLVSDATRRRQSAAPGTVPPTPPHLLPPDRVILAHLARPLAASRSQLNARLQNVQSDNECLFGEVEAQRKEIDALLSELEAAGADVDAANGLLAEVVDDLAREAREVEVEMEGT